jgi:hypothetical protein
VVTEAPDPEPEADDFDMDGIMSLAKQADILQSQASRLQAGRKRSRDDENIVLPPRCPISPAPLPQADREQEEEEKQSDASRPFKSRRITLADDAVAAASGRTDAAGRGGRPALARRAAAGVTRLLNDADAAAAAIYAAAAPPDPSATVESELDRAGAALRRRDGAAAASATLRALRLGPAHPDALCGAAALLLPRDGGEAAAAAAMYEAALRAAPSHACALGGLAALLRDGPPGLQLSRGSAAPAARLARAAARRRAARARAAACFAAARAAAPGRAELLVEYADLAEREGDVRLAAELYECAPTAPSPLSPRISLPRPTVHTQLALVPIG